MAKRISIAEFESMAGKASSAAPKRISIDEFKRLQGGATAAFVPPATQISDQPSEEFGQFAESLVNAPPTTQPDLDPGFQQQVLAQQAVQQTPADPFIDFNQQVARVINDFHLAPDQRKNLLTHLKSWAMSGASGFTGTEALSAAAPRPEVFDLVENAKASAKQASAEAMATEQGFLPEIHPETAAGRFAQRVVRPLAGFAAKVAPLAAVGGTPGMVAGFEAVNAASGGQMGQGAAEALTFKGMGAAGAKVLGPLGKTAAKAGELAGESAAGASLAKIHGGDTYDVLVGVGVPFAMRVPKLGVGLARKAWSWYEANPDVKLPEKPSRLDLKELGRTTEEQRIEISKAVAEAQQAEAIRRQKREMKANVEEGMEVQPTRRDMLLQMGNELGRVPTNAEIASRFEVSKEEASLMRRSTEWGSLPDVATSAKTPEAPPVKGPRVNENLRARARELGLKVSGLSDDVVLKKIQEAEAAQSNMQAEAATGRKVEVTDEAKVQEQIEAPQGPRSQGRAEDAVDVQDGQGRQAAAGEPSWLKKKGTAARAELDSALGELINYASPKAVGGKGNQNPLDPEMLRLAGRVVASGVKAGAYTFGEFVEYAARKVGPEVVARMGTALEQSWNDLRKNDTRLSDIRPVREILGIEAPRGENYGRPDLSYQKSPEGMRPIQDAANQQAKESGMFDPVSLKENAARAEARVAANLDAEVAKAKEYANDPLNKAQGQAASAEDIVTFQKVRDAAFSEAAKTGNLDRLSDAVDAHVAAERAASRAGRTLMEARDNIARRAQEDPHSVIMDELLELPSSKRMQHDEAMEFGNTKRANKLRAQWAKKAAKLQQKLARRGYDLSDKELINGLPRWRQEWLRQRIAEQKADWIDKWSEFRRSGMMTFPLTWGKNIASNLVNQAWQGSTKMVERTLTGGIKLATGKQIEGAASFGELKYATRAAVDAFGSAWSNAFKSMLAEAPMYDIERANPEIFTSFDSPRTAIKGIKGRAIRALGYDMNLVADQFIKTFVGEATIAEHAYRIARDAGLKGEALEARMRELINDPTSKARLDGLKEANEQLFQAKPGPIMSSISGLRNQGHNIVVRLAAHALMPFVTTPANVAKIGLKGSPLGAYRLIADILKARRTGDWSKVPNQAAQTLVATGLVYALAQLVDPEDGRPLITGSSPVPGQDPANPDKLIPQFSVRIGDTYYSYAEIEPVATILGLSVDTAYAIKEGDWAKAAAPFNAIKEQVANKTFLRAIGDLVRIMDSSDQKKQLAEFGSNLVVSHVPNIIRGTSRRLQDSRQDRRMPGKTDPDYWDKFKTKTLQKTELGIVDSYPLYSILGEPIDPKDRNKPVTDFLYRMAVPAAAQEEKTKRVYRAIINWNLQHPTEPYNPDAPDRYFTRGGKKVWLDEEKYSKFTRLAGMYTREALSSVDMNPNKPSAEDMKKIKSAISAGRKRARQDMFGE